MKIISFEVFKNYNESQIDMKKARKSVQNENHKKCYELNHIIDWISEKRVECVFELGIAHVNIFVEQSASYLFIFIIKITSTCSSTFCFLQKASQNFLNWSNSYKRNSVLIIRRIYEAVVVSQMIYNCSIWYTSIEKTNHKRWMFENLQRLAIYTSIFSIMSFIFLIISFIFFFIHLSMFVTE